jgi:hypothetical protein
MRPVVALKVVASKTEFEPLVPAVKDSFVPPVPPPPTVTK